MTTTTSTQRFGIWSAEKAETQRREAVSEAERLGINFGAVIAPHQVQALCRPVNPGCGDQYRQTVYAAIQNLRRLIKAHPLEVRRRDCLVKLMGESAEFAFGRQYSVYPMPYSDIVKDWLHWDENKYLTEVLDAPVWEQLNSQRYGYLDHCIQQVELAIRSAELIVDIEEFVNYNGEQLIRALIKGSDAENLLHARKAPVPWQPTQIGFMERALRRAKKIIDDFEKEEASASSRRRRR